MFFVIVDAFMESPAKMTMWKRCAAKFHAEPICQKSDISVLGPFREHFQDLGQGLKFRILNSRTLSGSRARVQLQDLTLGLGPIYI